MDRNRKTIFTIATIITIIYLYASLSGFLSVVTGGTAAVFLGIFILTAITLNEGDGFEIFAIIIIDIFIGTVIFAYLNQEGIFPLAIGTGIGLLWLLFLFLPSITELLNNPEEQ